MVGIPCFASAGMSASVLEQQFVPVLDCHCHEYAARPMDAKRAAKWASVVRERALSVGSVSRRIAYTRIADAEAGCCVRLVPTCRVCTHLFSTTWSRSFLSTNFLSFVVVQLRSIL